MLTNNSQLKIIDLCVDSSETLTTISNSNLVMFNKSKINYVINSFMSNYLLTYNLLTGRVNPDIVIKNKKLLKMFSKLIMIRNRARSPLHPNLALRRFMSKNIRFKKTT